MQIVNDRFLKDALHNMAPGASVSEDYARGILVGCVSGLMSIGFEFDRAIHLCSLCAPRTIVPGSVPHSWFGGFGLTDAVPKKGATHWVRPEGI